MRKKIAILLMLILLVSSLTGCHSKSNNASKDTSLGQITSQDTTNHTDLSTGPITTNDTPSDQTGRYIEEGIDFPTELTDGSYTISSIQSQCEDSLVEIIASNESERTFLRFSFTKDSTWESEDITWINGLLPENLGWIQELYHGLDGIDYLFYFTVDDSENYIPHILRQTSETSGEELTIPYLMEKDANGDYPYPQNMQVDRDGTIYLLDDKNCISIHPTTFDAQYTYNFTGYIASAYLSDDSIYFVCVDDNQIMQYNKTNYTLTNTYSFNSINPYNAKVCTDQEHQLFLILPEGIYKIQAGNSIWEMILDGSLSVLCDPSNGTNSFFAGSDADYYFCLKDKIYHCYYDPNVPAQPTDILTIYSLYDNSEVREAIAAYQNQHPDRKVSFRISSTASREYERASVSIEDYIDALNTELLAGKGADLLLLDDLPYDSYIEKGILADLYEYVPSLKESGTYLDCIVKTSETNGKLYDLPLRFCFQVVVGPDHILQQASDFHSLVSYMKTNQYTDCFEGWPCITFADFLLNLEAKHFFTKGEEFSQAEMVQLFQDMKDLQSITTLGLDFKTIETEDQSIQYYDSVYKNQNTLYAAAFNDFYYNSLMCDIVARSKKSFQLVNGQYIPRNIIGINQASLKKEAAGEFIECLLSLQNPKSEGFSFDYQYPILSSHDALPICPASLDILLEVDDDSIGGGVGIDYFFGYPEKSQREQFLSLAQSVTAPRPYQATLYRLYKDVIIDFMVNDLDVNETANQLYNRVSLYFSE